MKRKLFAAVLAASLLLTFLPVNPAALAADNGGTAGETSNTGKSNGSNDAGSNNGGRDRDTDGRTNPTPVTTTTTVDRAWITRQDLPRYATDFYYFLVRGSDNDYPGSDVFTVEGNYTVNTQQTEQAVTKVSAVTVVDYTEPSYAAGDALPVTGALLGQESVYQLDVSAGDQAINYNSLTLGSVVKTSSFNGIYVTSVTRTNNPSYDADIAAATDNIQTACRAFDKDHPEVFWLNGKTRLRIGVAEVTRSGKQVQEAFFFYVLADDSGFTVRDGAYAASGAIQAGIQRRDAAVKTILASVPKSGEQAQVKALNTWLTQHNEYNTSLDLNAIGLGPHRCLSALTGSVGTVGPVCEGYAKAFKVLCDQLGIPCVLEVGYARATPSGAAGLHMWNVVKMSDGKWYGADITWDDPVVTGKTGAVSGMENENYLLVGSSTVIRDMRFDASHQPDGQSKGPYLNATSYTGTVIPVASDLPFTDVPADAYYASAVKWALENQVTTGTSATTFAPNMTCTRAQVVTFLWRAKGEPAPKNPANPFADVKNGSYYHTAVLWAVEQGITTGTSATAFSPEMTCSRSQIITFLWRCMGKPGNAGSAVWYADAVNWANQNGLLAGTAQAFTPDGACPRSDVVTYLYRALNK